ncbi:ABC transporter ATP-binding protein [Deminuibacter soli]|uniref:ABC transporter ATP-binding protein n=1 Tax=Deminuibacter soli TaxID=2291815 RepID=A0A3E1NNK4_9BACT|nr:ABC transporter ATP-binding protein [Deminuibacter soli]RFM29500.1 ABC transporter ATP-binding protein [Deminuibacter soli]
MIDIQNLHFSYKRKNVLSDLSVQFQPGYIYGLLGKNGAGKSTMMHNIAGLLFPKQGKVDVLGYVPSKRQPAFLQEIFMIPEEFHLPDITIGRLVRDHAVFYPKFNQQQFERYLSEFQVPLADKLPQASYGQKKKLLISFALACNTSILLMDEPTNGLDIISKSQFRKVLASVVDENKCILISTHQVKDLENLIDRITVIDNGNILFDQSIPNITRHLDCRLAQDSFEAKEALYAEETFRGNVIVTTNNNGHEGKLDLELLYKAVMNNPARVNEAFHRQPAVQY